MQFGSEREVSREAAEQLQQIWCGVVYGIVCVGVHQEIGMQFRSEEEAFREATDAATAGVVCGIMCVGVHQEAGLVVEQQTRGVQGGDRCGCSRCAVVWYCLCWGASGDFQLGSER